MHGCTQAVSLCMDACMQANNNYIHVLKTTGRSQHQSDRYTLNNSKAASEKNIYRLVHALLSSSVSCPPSYHKGFLVVSPSPKVLIK